MKKVALGLVLAALVVLAACSKSSDSGQNQQYCNSYGQCYNTSANSCGANGLSGVNGSPFAQIGNGQCYNRLTGQAATPQQCYATGANTINGTGVNNGLYCNQFGLSSNVSQFGLPSVGLCPVGTLQLSDPTTGITQCAPTTSYGQFSSGIPSYYAGSPFLYAPSFYGPSFGGPSFGAGISFGFFAGIR